MAVKLITKQQGIELVQKWFDMPTSYKFKKASYRRNHDHHAPFYTLDLHWNKGLEIVLDALTGRIVEYIRRERPPEESKRSKMDYDIFDQLHSKVLDWLEKLELQIADSELLIFRKTVEGDNERFELEYMRQRDGIKIRDYQILQIKFNKKHDLVSLRVCWDDVDFKRTDNYLSADDMKQKLTPEQLVLVYFPRQSNPIYACKDEWFEAVTGRKMVSGKLEVVQANHTMGRAKQRQKEENKSTEKTCYYKQVI